MSEFTYYTKEGKFEANDLEEIPWDDLHSLNDNPAYEDLSSGLKAWYFEGNLHREIGLL